MHHWSRKPGNLNVVAQTYETANKTGLLELVYRSLLYWAKFPRLIVLIKGEVEKCVPSTCCALNMTELDSGIE